MIYGRSKKRSVSKKNDSGLLYMRKKSSGIALSV